MASCTLSGKGVAKERYQRPLSGIVRLQSKVRLKLSFNLARCSSGSGAEDAEAVSDVFSTCPIC